MFFNASWHNVGLMLALFILMLGHFACFMQTLFFIMRTIFILMRTILFLMLTIFILMLPRSFLMLLGPHRLLHQLGLIMPGTKTIQLAKIIHHTKKIIKKSTIAKLTKHTQITRITEYYQTTLK